MNQISWLVTTYHAWVDANHWVPGFIQVAGHHRARLKRKWGRKCAPEPYCLGKTPRSATCYHVPLGNILTPSDLGFLIWQDQIIRPISYGYCQSQISKCVKCLEKCGLCRRPLQPTSNYRSIHSVSTNIDSVSTNNSAFLTTHQVTLASITPNPNRTFLRFPESYLPFCPLV